MIGRFSHISDACQSMTRQREAGLSAGIAGHRPGENYSETVNRADGALLQAKQQGRNLCRLAN